MMYVLLLAKYVVVRADGSGSLMMLSVSLLPSGLGNSRMCTLAMLMLEFVGSRVMLGDTISVEEFTATRAVE